MWVLTIRGDKWRRGLLSLGALSAIAMTSGCQVDISGQKLPSPYWHTDDVQYFPPGPEFKLQNEVDAMAAAQAEEARTGGGGQPRGQFGPPPAPMPPAGGPAPMP